MTTKTTTPPAPAQIDAVAGALGVELTDADRATHQLESSATPAADPPAGTTTPPVDDKTPAPGATPPAGDPAAPVLGADGKPVEDGKPGDPTPEEIAAILDGKPLPGAEAKPEDVKTGDAVLDDPLPEGLKDSTRERMEKLLTRGRESHTKIQDLSAEVEELRPLAEQAEGWQAVVIKSGLQPEEFATVMGTMAYINNGTLAEKRVAFGRIEAMYKQLATELGEDPGADPLANHADLKGMVERQELPMAQAVELAQGRNRRKAEEAAAAEGDTATQLANARTAAEQRLNVLGQQLAVRDGNATFMIRKHIALKALAGQVANLHPNQWEAAFQRAYDATPKAVVDATLAQLGKGNGAPRRQTPIMGGGSGGGTGGSGAPGGGNTPTRKIETTQDAVFAALGIPNA